MLALTASPKIKAALRCGFYFGGLVSKSITINDQKVSISILEKMDYLVPTAGGSGDS